MHSHIVFNGGLGDVIWQYYTNPAFRRLVYAKRLFPELHFTAVVTSHTEDQAVDIFALNPLIDAVATYPYGQPCPWGWDKELHCTLDNIWNILDEDVPICLDEDEQKILDSLPRPFVTFHPFAGAQNRRLDMMLNVEKLVEDIVDRYGFNVVVLGGSHVRGNRTMEFDLQEMWEYDRPGVISLVGKASPRLSTKVAQAGKYFVGSHSCWMMAAWTKKVPTFVVGPDELATYLAHGTIKNGKIRTPYLDHLFLPGNLLMMANQAKHYRRFLDHFFRLVGL